MSIIICNYMYMNINDLISHFQGRHFSISLDNFNDLLLAENDTVILINAGMLIFACTMLQCCAARFQYQNMSFFRAYVLS